MKIHNINQSSEEWHNIRAGKFTASNFGKLFMSKSTAGYQDLINEVVYKRITGEIPETFKSSWMERGNELEPAARDAYELLTFNKVFRVGFGEYSEWVGGSPDGLIGSNGILEIKCPKFSTLIKLHLDNKIDKNYYWQMQGLMMIFSAEWCDYFVYDPNMKPFLKRINRNEDDILLLQKELNLAIELAIKRINLLK